MPNTGLQEDRTAKVPSRPDTIAGEFVPGLYPPPFDPQWAVERQVAWAALVAALAHVQATTDRRVEMVESARMAFSTFWFLA